MYDREKAFAELRQLNRAAAYEANPRIMKAAAALGEFIGGIISWGIIIAIGWVGWLLYSWLL